MTFVAVFIFLICFFNMYIEQIYNVINYRNK